MGVNRDEEGVLGTVYRTTNLTVGVDDLAAADALNASSILDSNLFPLGTSSTNNATLDVFNTTTRISTDVSFRCYNQFEAYAGVKNECCPISGSTSSTAHTRIQPTTLISYVRLQSHLLILTATLPKSTSSVMLETLQTLLAMWLVSASLIAMVWMQSLANL